MHPMWVSTGDVSPYVYFMFPRLEQQSGDDSK
ncbi:unnamed protein product [Spirodela intermedia]|uniref:Uncharacterized protein n=1 Tax=Spirodela intermedia TaxID=51605 RepID=A0A7I8IS09_SPIIN|nr:unnamed protein product [Spirodela intermedia]CAA6659944.1 unnamed protein product [Spirodela intermedia]